MKMRDLVVSVDSLKKLADLEMQVKVAYSLAKFIKLVEVELTIYDKSRLAILKKFGTKSDDETSYTIEAKNEQNFSNELEELLELEVDIEIPKLTLKDLESDKNTLSASDMLNLQFLLNLE